VSAILAIDGLSVEFRRAGAAIGALRQVGLKVAAGECVGIVGESGSGKTQLGMAVMGLLPANAAASGSIRFAGREILAAPRALLQSLRGAKLAMIFQDPQSSLTPHLRIGVQLAEVLVFHRKMPRRRAQDAALAMLRRVGIDDAARRMRQYPHELSGGMRQRVLIGMSLLCGPDLLIADEPTTALDVAVQAQVIGLLQDMRREFHTAIVLISHDLAVVAGLAERIYVMYAGRIVETARAADLYRGPRHPYTAALLRCAPRIDAALAPRLDTLPGQPPNLALPIEGCAFAPRCWRATERCTRERPLLLPADATAQAACHHPLCA